MVHYGKLLKKKSLSVDSIRFSHIYFHLSIWSKKEKSIKTITPYYKIKGEQSWRSYSSQVTVVVLWSTGELYRLVPVYYNNLERTRGAGKYLIPSQLHIHIN